MQVPNVGPVVEARLGDLDLKSSDVKKAERWKNTELRLTVEGWYTHKEKNSEAHDNGCYLNYPHHD